MLRGASSRDKTLTPRRHATEAEQVRRRSVPSISPGHGMEGDAPAEPLPGATSLRPERRSGRQLSSSVWYFFS